MTITRTPLVSSVDPDSFANGVITSGSSTKNTLYTQYPGDKTYGEQRISIDVFTEPNEAAESRQSGRGIVFWPEVGSYYFVRDNELYKDDYNTLVGGVTEGDHPIYFAVVGIQLAIIDPYSGNGYWIDSSAPTTLNPFADAQYPGTGGLGLKLAGGAVSLDGYLFVMDQNGVIYNCNLNRVDLWDGLDFISTDTSADGGIYLAKHHNHLCAIGENSTEFFFNAGNPVGSPLQLRQDVSFLIGGIDFASVTESGDNTFFIGRESNGTVGLFRLNRFEIGRVSTDSIDRYISHVYTSTSVNAKDMKVVLGSAWFGENLLCFLTAVEITPARYDLPIQTLAFDSTNKLWSIFDTGISIIDKFSVISTPDSTVSRATQTFPTGSEATIMFISGAIANVGITSVPQDTDSVNSQTTDIDMNITTLELDFDILTNKFQHRLAVVGTTTAGAADTTPIQVSWTDDRYRTFSTARNLDTGLRRSLTRGGLFKRRAYSLDYSGPDMIRLESLEFDIRNSGFA